MQRHMNIYASLSVKIRKQSIINIMTEKSHADMVTYKQMSAHEIWIIALNLTSTALQQIWAKIAWDLKLLCWRISEILSDVKRNHIHLVT